MPSSTKSYLHPSPGARFAGLILFGVIFLHTLPLAAKEKAPAHPCLAKLQNPSHKNIDCILDFDLGEGARKDLNGVTAGVLRNATCKVKVSVAREKLFTALLNEKILEVPKQPVKCMIITNGEPLPTKFTLAPKVWFKAGKAVHAKPGMGNLLGMPPFLAKLLEDWVNSSKMIESAMVHEVNAFLKSGLPL